MKKKIFNLYIIFFIILILFVTFFIYNRGIENFQEKVGHVIKKDQEGHITHYSRVPTEYDPNDRFNYGVDTVPGAINEGFQISPPLGTTMELVDASRNIISDPLKVHLIFYGNWSYAKNTTVKLIQDFIKDLGASSYFRAAVNRYSGADGRAGTTNITLGTTYFDTDTDPVGLPVEGNEERNATDDIITRNITKGKLPLDPLTPENLILDADGQRNLLKTSVYCVILASTVRVHMERINGVWKPYDSCAWHGMATLKNRDGSFRANVLSISIMNVHAAAKNSDGTLIRNPNGDVIYPFQNCSTLFALRNFVPNIPDKNSITRTPLNDNVGESCMDALVHEIVEVITDPSSASKEWVQTADLRMRLPRAGPNLVDIGMPYPLENADLCAYNYGRVGNILVDGSIDRVKKSKNGSYTNVQFGGKEYFLPTMFVKTDPGKQKGRGECLFGIPKKKK